MPAPFRRCSLGKSGTSLVEVLVSIVLLGLSATLTVRVLSGAARSLDQAEVGFREMVRLPELGEDSLPRPDP